MILSSCIPLYLNIKIITCYLFRPHVHRVFSSSVSQSFFACLSLRFCLASDTILSIDSRIGTHMGRKSGMQIANFWSSGKQRRWRSEGSKNALSDARMASLLYCRAKPRFPDSNSATASCRDVTALDTCGITITGWIQLMQFQEGEQYN